VWRFLGRGWHETAPPHVSGCIPSPPPLYRCIPSPPPLPLYRCIYRQNRTAAWLRSRKTKGVGLPSRAGLSFKDIQPRTKKKL
jgi:hypothetical protein